MFTVVVGIFLEISTDAYRNSISIFIGHSLTLLLHWPPQDGVLELLPQLLLHLDPLRFAVPLGSCRVALHRRLVIGNFIDELLSVVLDVVDGFEGVAEQDDLQDLYCILIFE
jgi:hypothetical protein